MWQQCAIAKKEKGFVRVAQNCLLFTISRLFGTKESIRQNGDKSWRTDCPVVLSGCHKLDQGDCVCSLRELSKSASMEC
jgi:hypothetical protein